MKENQTDMPTKCYEINKSNLDSQNESVFMGYIDIHSIYANTQAQAKKQALAILRDHGVADMFGEELNFATVKVRRNKEFDRVVDEDGSLKTRFQIEQRNLDKEYRDNLDKLLADNPNSFAYIRKGGYYYGPNNAGYTEFQSRAGVYTIKQAVSEKNKGGLINE